MADKNENLAKAVAEARKKRDASFDVGAMIDKLAGKGASDPMYAKAIDLYVKIGGGEYGTTRDEIIAKIDEAVKRSIEARKKDGIPMKTFASAVKYTTDVEIGAMCMEIASNPRTKELVRFDPNYPKLSASQFYAFTEKLKIEYGGYLFTASVVRNEYNSKPRTPEFVLFDPKGGSINSKWDEMVKRGRIPANAGAQTKTAWCDPNCLMAYNVEFTIGIMVQAYLTGTNAGGAIRGKKYKCNGGEFPDYFWPLEYLIVHEVLHFRMGDFYLGDLMGKELDKLGKSQKMIDPKTNKPIMVPFSKTPFGRKVLNIANDLINNWIICEKYGLPPLTGGYTSEEVTKEKMMALAKERGEHWLVTTFKVVMGDLRALNKNDQEEFKEETKKGDQHQQSQDKSNDKGEQGDPQDGQDDGQGGEPPMTDPGSDDESQDGDGQDGEGDADGQEGDSQDGDGSGEGDDAQDGKDKKKGKGKGKGKPSDEPMTDEELDDLNSATSEANQSNGDAPEGTKNDEGKEQSNEQKEKLQEKKKKVADALEKNKDKGKDKDKGKPDGSPDGEQGDGEKGDGEQGDDKKGDGSPDGEGQDGGDQGEESGKSEQNGGNGDSVGNDKGEEGDDFDPMNSEGGDANDEKATRDAFDKASDDSNPYDEIDRAYDDMEDAIDSEVASEIKERDPEEAREMERRKDEADREARNALGKTLEDKLAAIKATAKITWQQMLKNFFKTNAMQQESYAKMSAQTIVNITSSTGDDGVAIDPGMVKEQKKNKVRAVFVFDVSGSVHRDIGKANTNLWKLVKQYGTQFEECWFVRFSSAMDFDIHILSDGKLFKGKKLSASGRMKVIANHKTGVFKLDEKDIFPRERPFVTILKGESGVETNGDDPELSAIPGGGGTEFNATILNILESLYRRGCGVIFFTDDDCASGSNLKSFKHMVFDVFGVSKKRPRSIGICLTKEADFQSMVKALGTDGQSDPVWDMTYFTSGAFEEADFS